MDNDRDFHCDFDLFRIESFNSDVCIFSLIICYFPLKGIVFPPCPFPMAQGTSDICRGY